MRALTCLLVVLSCATAAAAPFEYRSASGVTVPGGPLEGITALGPQVQRVRRAVKDALGVEIGSVPVHVVTIEELRTLHDEGGGILGHGYSLFGFEHEGHVFVRRALGGIPDEVLIHECLHAMSARFSRQVHLMGVGKIVEGITQYFTLEALAARPDADKLVHTKNRTYVAFTELADALATLVGEQAPRRAYFEGDVNALAVRVDVAAHGRHVFLRAARALEAGDPRGALALLGGG